jgi:hypothetical protein
VAEQLPTLLPCPFCGCKAVWFKTGRDIGIECEDGFDCPGRAQTNVYDPEHRQDVIAQWNRRVLPTREDIRDMADIEALDELRREVEALRADRDRLDALEAHSGWEASFQEGGDCECAWQVHCVSGGRNDREWKLIGQGETLRAAIDTAWAPINLQPKGNSDDS